MAPLRASNPRDQGGSHNAFSDLVSEVTYCHPQHTLSVTKMNPDVTEITQGHEYQKAKAIGDDNGGWLT